MKRKWLFIGGIPVLVLLAGVIWLAGLFYDLPSVEPDSLNLRRPGIRITDRYGQTLYEVIRDEQGSQMDVNLEKIPKNLRRAAIDTEDAHFYENPGVDLTGLLRAFWINLTGGETLSGGSTITQQVARNLLLSSEERAERTVSRKLREMILAWQLTNRYSKDEILALYLNQTYYGGMTYGAGIVAAQTYGVEAAARTYFGKPLEKLSLAECALLAGLPQAPALYNPYTDLEAARRRRNVVIDLMLKAGDISDVQAGQAKNEPVTLSADPFPWEAPHFAWLVRSTIDGLFSPEDIQAKGGLVVRTSLNLAWQQLTEKAVHDQLAYLQQSEGGHDVHNAAVVAIDPHNGQVLAMVGSPDFFDSRHDGALNMATSARQPGSALKPFIYALALDPAAKEPWTAAEMLLDVNSHFLTRDGKTYTPANFNHQEHGPVSLRQALASSLNIPAVVALDHVGLDTAAQFFNRLGMDSLGNSPDLDISLALGGGEVSLLDLTGAYGSLANAGAYIPPVTILDIRDSRGTLMYQAQDSPGELVIDPRTAWLVSDILSDDDARSLGFPANSILNIGRPAAVKTGTTSNFHDNWTVGYTPDLVVGVWAGNAGQQPMQDVTGLSGSGPIWHTVMRSLTAGQPIKGFERPEGLQQVEVCALSGKLPGPACPYTRHEWFIDGTAPTQTDHVFHKVMVDAESGRLADDRTPPDRLLEVTALDLPAQAAPWARQNGLILWDDLISGMTDGVTGPDAETGVWITSPGAGSVYVLTSKKPRQDQQILIEAAVKGNQDRMVIYVDGSPLADFSAPPYRAWWPLSPGKHLIWAQTTDSAGNTLTGPSVEINVMDESS